MAFVSGPRQVGKTTTCRRHTDAYCNWDNLDDRELVLAGPANLAARFGANRLSETIPVALFDELPFSRFGKDEYVINVPYLTIKEMRHLNAQLPKMEEADLDIPGVPPSDVKAYAELYRYFPTFAEAIFT